MKEVWKVMKEHNGYEVSNKGEIRNKKTKRILKSSISYKGYKRFIVYINKKGKCLYIHRVVANNFIKNPNNYDCINHKDENKLNNNVNNLEWCDISYNNKYGTRIERILETKRKKGIISN